MPSKDVHLATARANHRTLNYLRADAANHLPWIVTVAFYEALHVVEAVFAVDGKHCEDHKMRNRILKSENRYQQLWRMYSPLWQASLIARYLRIDQSTQTIELFESYMPTAVVEQKILGHYLYQLEKSACQLLGDDSLLRR